MPWTRVEETEMKIKETSVFLCCFAISIMWQRIVPRLSCPYIKVPVKLPKYPKVISKTRNYFQTFPNNFLKVLCRAISTVRQNSSTRNGNKNKNLPNKHQSKIRRVQITELSTIQILKILNRLNQFTSFIMPIKMTNFC